VAIAYFCRRLDYFPDQPDFAEADTDDISGFSIGNDADRLGGKPAGDGDVLLFAAYTAGISVSAVRQGPA